MESQPVGFEMRVCMREGCGLRFPMEAGSAGVVRCPRCRAETHLALAWEPANIQWSGTRSGLQLEGLLDNIRSSWNVGAIFRTADGMGVQHLHLAGTTPTPENPKVLKTSLGAEVSVAWSWSADALKTAYGLKRSGKALWGLELDRRAEPLTEAELLAGEQGVALVVGNERSGIDPEILQLCDQVVAVPMLGGKRSLNVAIAFAIAVYHLRFLDR